MTMSMLSSTTTSTTAATATATAAGTASSASPALVNLLDLAAACVACTVTASRQILKRAGSSDNHVRFKQDGSFVTDADFVAQGVIVQAIQSVSTDLRIVGEESPEEMARHISLLTSSTAPSSLQDPVDKEILQRTALEIRLLYHKHAAKDQETLSTLTTVPDKLPLAPNSVLDSSIVLPADPADCFVDPRRVCVIVDPLDGTKSYAHGEYDAVSILIGICLDNKPYFGVVGKPFGYTGLTNILDSSCATLYGGPFLNAVYVAGGPQIHRHAQHQDSPTPIVEHKLPPRAVISSSRAAGLVEDFCRFLTQEGLLRDEPMHVAGAGEKSLRLILQRHDEALWFFPKVGTSRWDVAAPDALLRVLGGKLTDKYGNELDYSADRSHAENMDGIVASIDPVLHENCIRLFLQGDWATR